MAVRQLSLRGTARRSRSRTEAISKKGLLRPFGARNDGYWTASKAQSTMEYMVVFAILVAALVAMQVYLKRGMQGRMRGYVAQLSQGAAYSPGATNSFSEVITNTREASISQNPADSASDFRISISNANVEQDVFKIEDTLPFNDEPRRR